MIRYAYVNVYEVECCYGGPEEGGWWYDAGTLVPDMGGKVPIDNGDSFEEQRAKVLPTLTRWSDECKAMNEGTLPRSSVVGTSDLEATWEDEPGKDYPQERPYYE